MSADGDGHGSDGGDRASDGGDRATRVRLGRLLGAFEAGAIERFDHQAHVTVAFAYVWREGEPRALGRLRAGLRRLLAIKGAPPTAYHETRTVAWLRVVAHTMRLHAALPLGLRLERVLEHCGDRALLDAYYSRERLALPAAREGFLAPDLAPLPGASW